MNNKPARLTGNDLLPDPEPIDGRAWLDAEIVSLLFSVEALHGALPRAIEQGLSIDDCIDLIFTIADARRDLGFLDDMLRKEIQANAGAKKIETAHGVVEIKQSTRRTQWDKDALLAHATARIIELPGVLTDEEGEIRPPAAIAAEVVAKLRDVVSISAGKVTGMRALGLQPDEFCQEDPQGWSLVLPARTER